MGRKAERGSRGKSVVVSGGGKERNRPSPNPSRKREGSKIGAAAAAPRIKSGVRERENPFMPGLRVRSDGWTAARTRVFLATLGRTGCVTDAARIAGVSTTSVNRSRALFPPFDKACGEAITRALRGLEAVAYERAVAGRETVVIRGGKEVERRIVPSDAMLGLLIKRGDLRGGRNVHLTPEEAAAYVLPEAVRHRFLSMEEYASGLIFEKDKKGKGGIIKITRPTQEETDAVLIERIQMISRYRQHQRRIRGECLECGQPIMLSENEVEMRERDAAAQRQLAPPED